MHNIKNMLASVAAMLLAIGASHAQEGSITLPASRVTVGQLVDAIDEQTDYNMAYAGSTLDRNQSLTVTQTITVKSALDMLVKTEEVTYQVKGNYILITPDPRPKQESQPEPFVPVTKPTPASEPATAPVPVYIFTQAPPPAPAPVVESGGDVLNLGAKDFVPRGLLPVIGIKTNLLYWALGGSPNAGLEIGLSNHSSLDLTFGFNTWNRKKSSQTDNKQLLHWMAKGEYRYWFCERFDGHFLGVHGFYNQFNVAAYNLPLITKSEYRYEGNAIGGGLTYGYALPLGKSWNLEFLVGAGAAYLDYDRFACNVCANESIPKNHWYFGPTRAAINLVLLIK
jgi:hypothetical protein